MIHCVADRTVSHQLNSSDYDSERMIDPEADCHIHLEDLTIKIRLHFDKNAGC